MFGSTKKIAIDKSLYDRLAELAAARGYASTDEFVVHLCERETAASREKLDEGEVEQQLRGLGYIE
ncbi:MAG: hypothetical protein DWQ37_18655 [Planctomycetota bacterium]|nr:MAG: hypothetical protein DWQ37_18655 [Planctomycetota bacterium]